MSKFSRLIRSLLILSSLLVVLPSSVFAQGYGKISGTVTDPSGAAVPNASIVATRLATGDKSLMSSNGEGEFVFPALPPAEYSINVTANGFAGFLQQNVVLQADQSINLNIPLKVGSSGETVSVSAAPPQVDVSTGT